MTVLERERRDHDHAARPALRYIHELKKQPGIDWDVHASNRFVER